MAFTDEEEQLIRQYLGWSELYWDIDARIQGQLEYIGSDPERAPAATRVRAHLAELQDIDERLKNALDNLTLVKAEDVEFRGDGELEALRRHGRSVIQRLAIIFDVKPQRDYYGSEVPWTGEFGVGGW